MKKTLRITMAVLFTLLAYTTSYAQVGSAEIPSLSKSAGYIYIENKTNQEVTFYLESENTARTEQKLAPGMGATYSGGSNDQWFNIHVYSGSTPNVHETVYGLDAGTRHYIAWNGGVLDVFLIPPR